MTVYVRRRLPGVDLGSFNVPLGDIRVCAMPERDELWLYLDNGRDLRPLATVRELDGDGCLSLAAGVAGIVPHSPMTVEIRQAAVDRWRAYASSRVEGGSRVVASFRRPIEIRWASKETSTR